MTIDEERLNRALSIIKKEDGKLGMGGAFSELFSHLLTDNETRKENHEIYSSISYIVRDLWNLNIILKRIFWEYELWMQEEIDDVEWMQYASCDIDLFHIEIRSIFDYVARIIKYASSTPDQLPERFTKLINWVNKPINDSKLEPDLKSLVTSPFWFKDFKNIRDSIVHRGGFTIVFLVRDKILFQVNQGFRQHISFPELMHNKNVVDFKLYAGLYIGYLYDYLEDVAEVIDNRITVKKMGEFTVTSDNPTCHIIKNLIEQLIQSVNLDGTNE